MRAHGFPHSPALSAWTAGPVSQAHLSPALTPIRRSSSPGPPLPVAGLPAGFWPPAVAWERVVSGADARERAARAVVPPQVPGRGDPGATPARGSAGRVAGILPPGTGQGRRVTVTAAGVVVVLAAAAGAVWLAGWFGTRGPSGA